MNKKENNGRRFHKGKIGDRFRKREIDDTVIQVKNKKEYTKIVFLVLFLLVLFCGTSYALFSLTLNSEKSVKVVAGIFKVDFSEGNTITLSNAAPMTDEEGMASTPYTFSIENTGDVNAKYNISLEEGITNNSTLDKKYIKYSIKEDDGEWSTPALLSTGLTLRANTSLPINKKTQYQLKLWLDNDADNSVQGKNFSAKIVISSVQDNVDPKKVATPIVNLNGDNTVNIEKGELFTDPGVANISDDKDELDITDIVKTYEYYDGSNTIEVNNVDTTRSGVYYIYYKITDSDDNIGTAVRTVNVYERGNSIPNITLIGNSPTYIDKGDSYTELSATADDVEDGNLTDKIIIVGEVNTKVVNTYNVKYIVEDSDGNTASVTRTVIVNKKGSISINISEYEGYGENVDVPIRINAENGNVIGYYLTTENVEPSSKDYIKITETDSYSKVLNIKKNGTYYIWAKDSNGNIVSKSFVVSEIDDIKPSCSFSDVSYMESEKNNSIDLICTDDSDMDIAYLTDNDFNISDSSVASITDVSGPTKIENGYKYTISLDILNSGEFELSLNPGSVYDIYNNPNEKITKKITTIKMTAEIGSVDISTGSSGGQISVNNNVGELEYTVEDESIATVNSTGFVTGLRVGKTFVRVYDRTTGITTKIEINIEKTLTVNYVKNGLGVTAIGNLNDSNTKCTLTADNPNNCTVTLPDMNVSEGYTKIGWSQDQNTKTQSLISDTSAENGYIVIDNTITINSDITLYSISYKNKKTLTANLDENNATLSNNNNLSCEIDEAWNNETQDDNCSVTLPTISGSANTPIAVGFSSISSNEHTAEKASGATLTLNSENTGKIWYAITKSEEKNLIASYEINGDGIDEMPTLSDSNTKCTIGATYNGVKQNTSCNVTAPNYNVNDGYTSLGWSQNQNATEESQNNDATTKYVANGNLITLSANNTTLYTISYKNAIVRSATFVKNGSGVDSINSTKISCTIPIAYNNNEQATSCTPNTSLPSFNVNDGYTAIGWSQNKDIKVAADNDDVDATNGYISIGQSIELSSDNIVFYTISKKNSKTLTATFNENGSTINNSINSKVEKSCSIDEVWNNEVQNTTCSINDIPNITRDGFIILGYSTNKDNESKNINDYKSDSIDISSNVEYYANTYKDVTISWHANGSVIGSTSITNTIWNSSTEASITSPSISRTGYNIIGWNTNEFAEESIWNQNTAKNVSSNADYYAITSKGLTATFKYNDSENKVANKSESCNIYNTQSGCNITIPSSVTGSSGPNSTMYVGLSSSLNNANNTDLSEITLSDNSNYYAIYKKVINPDFYYYDNGVQKTDSSESGTRTSILKNSTDSTYTTSEGNVNIPSIVKSSKGIQDSTYQSVSNSVSSTNDSTVTSNSNKVVTTASDKYYAYYKGSWVIGYHYDTGIEGIGSTGVTCGNYTTTNGTTYTIKGIDSGAESCNVTLPTITPATGYSVSGWYESTVTPGLSQPLSAGASYKIIGNNILTARANINSYTVTYNYLENGGTSATKVSDSVNYGESADLTPTATKEGYDFLGWNTSSTATTGLATPPTITNNITLYAIFKKSTSISLSSKSSTYTGSEIIANTAIVEDGPSNPSISYTYYTDSSCSTKTSTSTGASISGGAPIDVGNYYVKATVAAATNFKSATTSCVAHSITKKEVSVTWEDKNIFTYNNSGQAPTASANSGVTGEVLNISRTMGTDADSYTSVATISSVTGGRGKASNYSLTNNSKDFQINQAQPELTLSAEAGSVNKGSTITFTAKSNIAGDFTNTSGETTVATVSPNNYSSVAANINKTITVTGVSNGTSIIKVLFTPSNTNYKSVYKTYTVTGYLVSSMGSCNNLTYNGESQTLASGGTGVTYSNNAGTNATSYTVTASSNSGYRYSDGTTSKTLSCSIAQKEVAYKSTTASKEYDGTELTANSATVTNGSLVNGHTATITTTGSITNVGSTTNTLSSVVIKSGTTDVSSNYNITKTSGTLTVTKRPITYTATTTSKSYDGIALTANSATVTSGSLVSGHTATITTTGSITNAGSTTNTLSSVVIKSGTIDVSSNYNITKVNGTLTVNKATATTGSCNSLTYNGTSQTLASGGTGVTYNNNTGTNADSYGVNAVANSNYIFSDGTSIKTLSCSIAQKAIKYTAISTSKTYDGTTLSSNSASLTSGSLVSGHTATTTVSGSITNAGSTTNTLSSVVIKSGTTDVSSNYNITKANGTLTVYKRPVTYTATTTSKTYNGTALTANSAPSLTANSASLTSGSLVSGHTATITTTGSITNAGSTTNTLSSVVIKSGSTDVSSNYEITKVNGTLTVEKAIFTSASVKINGTAKVGNTLTASVSTTPTGSYKYQWYRRADNINTAISGATSSTYVPTSSDLGKSLMVVVIYEKDNYYGNTIADEIDAANNEWSSVVSNIKPTCTWGSPTNNGLAKSSDTFSYSLQCKANEGIFSDSTIDTANVEVISSSTGTATVTSISKTKVSDSNYTYVVYFRGGSGNGNIYPRLKADSVSNTYNSNAVTSGGIMTIDNTPPQITLGTSDPSGTLYTKTDCIVSIPVLVSDNYTSYNNLTVSSSSSNFSSSIGGNSMGVVYSISSGSSGSSFKHEVDMRISSSNTYIGTMKFSIASCTYKDQTGNCSSAVTLPVGVNFINKSGY